MHSHLCPICHHNTQGPCRHCTTRLTKTLHTIRHNWLLLDTMLQPQDTPDHNTKRAHRIDPPAPARLDALILRDPRTHPDGHHQPIPRILHNWAILITANRGLQLPNPNPLHNLDTITTHLDWAITQAWAKDLEQSIHLIHQALNHATGNTPGHTLIPGITCPTLLDTGHPCASRLYQPHHQLSAQCPQCHTTWTGLHELQRLALLTHPTPTPHNNT